MSLARIYARLFNVPLMVMPQKLDQTIAALAPKPGIQGEISPPGLYSALPTEKRDPGYRVTSGGVAVVDVFGALVHRGAIQADSTYLLGYQEIAKRLHAAIEDPGVKAVLLQMDSPGGEVAGAFQLAEEIKRLSGRKPIDAVASDLMASAAYLIGSAADSISVAPTSQVGSIGVVMRHVNIQRALEQDGVQVEQIFAGARKVDGHPFGPLSDEARAGFQGEIDRIYGLFVRAVAAKRSMDIQKVMATEAALYSGPEAIALGLADRLETTDQAIARLERGQNQIYQSRLAAAKPTGKNSMNDEQTLVEVAAAISAQDLERAKAEGQKAGVAAERARIGAILTCQEAIGREAMAKTLALESEVAPDLAAKLLAAAPKVASTEANPFLSAMAAIGSPKLGPDGGDHGGEASIVKRILNA